MRSLQARLAVGLVVTVLVLFTAQWLVVNISLRNLTEEYFASRLTHDAEGLLAGIVFDNNHHPVVDMERTNPIYERVFSGHYYEVMSEGFVVRSHSLLDYVLKIKPVPAGHYTLTRTQGPELQPLIMLVAGYEKRGRLLTIAVAEDYSPIEGEYSVFQWRYVLITCAVLIGLIALQMWVVQRGLRPLEQVRADVQRLERGDIPELKGNVPTEIIPLVVEINRLITILGDRLERSRNSLGNLAHALKTPLTALDQLLNSDELRACPQLQAQLRDQSEIIGSFIQRELKRARLAGAVTPGGRFDVCQELPSLLTALKQIYRDKNLAVEWNIPPGLAYPAEREDMLELFGNLLDNACKWAVSKVLLSVESGPGLAFSIDDDGPGAPEERLEQLSARGLRLDESVGGYGLGLSISREIVNHYHGKIGFGRSTVLGGFRVWVCLPDLGNTSQSRY